MDISRIEKLENEISKKSFEKANRSKNQNWYLTSIIFQCLNVVICFFGLYLFLDHIIESFIIKQYIIGLISFLILFFWERLKREQIRSTIIMFLRDKNKINNKTFINGSLTLFLIVCSSLIAIQGGVELSNKEQTIDIKFDSLYQNKKDSINNYYINEQKTLQSRIDYVYESARTFKGEKRSLKTNEYQEIKDIDLKIKESKEAQNKSINQFEISHKKDKDKILSKNENIVTIFIIGSIVFEFFIIFGIAFCSNYDYFSYLEAVQSDSYKKQILYIDYLYILFENGKANKDDKSMSDKKITDIIRLRYKNTQHIREFLQLVNYLNIVETRRDRRKYYCKTYEEAINTLKDYFNNLK